MAMQATPLEPPYAVAVVFYMPRPAKPSYSWPVVGDIDKLVRCTLDGLVTGRVIKDDRHVIVLTSHQPLWRDCVGEIPGAQIVVESLA
jgi:Holliday junction resolvase RusA-like endonuclease